MQIRVKINKSHSNNWNSEAGLTKETIIKEQYQSSEFSWICRTIELWWISNESWNRFLDNANNSYIDFIQNPSLKERTLSHRLKVKIFRMALFKAVLQSLMSVAEKVFTSHAYEIIGTQLVYKSFMRTSSWGFRSSPNRVCRAIERSNIVCSRETESFVALYHNA